MIARVIEWIFWKFLRIIYNNNNIHNAAIRDFIECHKHHFALWLFTFVPEARNF